MSTQNLPMHVHSSFIHHCLDLEATTMSFSSPSAPKDNRRVVHQPRRDKLSNHEKTQRKLKCVLLSDRRQSGKTFQLDDILEKGKTGFCKKISGRQGLRVVGWGEWGQYRFLGQ